MSAWPQWVLITIFVFDFIVAAGQHGNSKGRYDVSVTAAAIALTSWLLWMGGFWQPVTGH